jgi:hypothetical protein
MCECADSKAAGIHTYLINMCSRGGCWYESEGVKVEVFGGWVVQCKRIPDNISLCKRNKHAASGQTNVLVECRNICIKAVSRT